MAFTPEQQQEIHDNLYKSLKGYASVQDINYAASRIIEDPSPENLDRVREGLIAVSAPTTSGIITPDNQIKNIIKNELIYMQSDVAEQTEEFIEENIANETYEVPNVTSDSVGSIIQLGEYTFYSDRVKRPISWVILKVDIENKKALIASEYVLEDMSFNNTINDSAPNTWENSSIRQWLNNEFYNAAFTTKEKTAIIETRIKTNGTIQKTEPSGSDFYTNDKVFLYGGDEYKLMEGKEYAALKRYLPDPNPNDWTDTIAYWGRNGGGESLITTYYTKAIYCTNGGVFVSDTMHYNYTQTYTNGIRPIMWVKIK